MAIKKRIIIDCDTGIDDAIAIMLAVKSKDLFVDSITTVYGNVQIKHTTVNTLKILEFIGRSDIPVYMGEDKPLYKNQIDSKYVFGEDGLGNISEKLLYKSYNYKLNAINHILHKVENKEIDTIIAIGPLTNIALAYKRNKKAMNSLKEIIVMGGAINVNGNITKYAEFNFYSDPHAADFVIKNSTNLLLIPLDVTTKVKFLESDFKKIQDTKKGKLIKRMVKTWFDFSKTINQNHISLHDPLAISYAINKNFVEIDNIAIEIVLNNSNQQGYCKINKIIPKIFYAKKLGEIDFKEYFINQFI